MKSYDEMSDFEINKLAWKLTNKGKTMYLSGSTIYRERTRYNEFNPCNDWGDAGPIIVDNDITVRGGGVAYYDGNECPAFVSRSENPLRAAMICFLKMKDAENA